MTERSEPPTSHEDGGSSRFELEKELQAIERGNMEFLPETKIQKAYKQATLYQEILDNFEGSAKELAAKGKELANKLNEICDHVGQDIIVNGLVTRVGIDLRSMSSNKANLKPEKNWDAKNVRAKSLGYAALTATNPQTKKPTARLYHVAKTEPLEVIANDAYGNIYQQFRLHLDPRHIGNAELVNEVFPPNDEWLRDEEKGLGNNFMTELDEILNKESTLREKLRDISKIDFASQERLRSKAYTDLKDELAYYISEKLNIQKGSLYFISGAKKVYYMHEDIPHDIAMAKGRYPNKVQRFNFVPHTTIPAIESITIMADGTEYEFLYPLTGKLSITKMPIPGFTDNHES